MKDHISICICTFHRNQMLERLLRSLSRQETGGLFVYSIVVVDNDVLGPAQETISRLRDELGLEIDYGIEPERTIPAARNHALRLARGNHIAIIDDDEFPPQTWLASMFRALRTFGVDGVLGPVNPFFAQEPPAWLIKGRFCERPVYRTGTLLRWDQTRTGNVLLKREVFDEHRLFFDPNWKTSGSDRAFFKSAMQLGYKFIFVEEAPVFENVPPERWKKTYYLKRALVQGFNAHRNSAGESRGVSRLLMPMKSAAAVVAYAIALPFAACIGTHVLVRCMEGGGHHLSRLSAMFGIELIKRRGF
ncbi:MAG: hypothetical protein A2V45_15540 [Candidatus Aminicenantes bacterium RBG_19FT_COMBO_58_17]|nr:MAG: hypothetical protein A2V45_15540 [Candidatus Aminicenantes bacterium RBG_19FT_COMBO_58_17]